MVHPFFFLSDSPARWRLQPPSESNFIAFIPHRVSPSSFEQLDDSRYLDGDSTHHNRCGPTPSIPNVNAQVPEPSTSSPTYTGQQSPLYPPPFTSFAEQPPVMQNLFAQPLALFHEQDITNSNRPSQYSRSDFNPSPVSSSNVDALTAAHPISSLPHVSYDNMPSSPSLFPNSQNSSEYIRMSTPTCPPTEHSGHVNVSIYDLPYVLTPSSVH